MKNCLLCHSDKTKTIQKIPTQQLVDLYQSELAIDVAQELAQYSTIAAIQCDNCKLVYFANF